MNKMQKSKDSSALQAAMYIQGFCIDWKAWLGNLFSLQGICTYSIIEPLWSLSYEVWFYILMGIISLFFVRQKMVFYKIFAIPLLLICFLVFTKLSPHYLFILNSAAF